MRLWAVLGATLTLLSADLIRPANAADIYCRADSAGCQVITLEGQIEEGDYRKFVDALRRSDGRAIILSMASPGGDLFEAMKIGRVVRDSLLITALIGECSSACSFIYAAGIKRFSIGSRIGVHRPSFDSSYFKYLAHKDASAAYAELTEIARAYLVKMGVSQSLIEATFNTPSHKITLLDEQQQRTYGLVGDEPATTEWLRARCGGLSEQEEADLPCTSKYSAIDKPECQGLSAGYIAYLDKQIRAIRACEEEEQVRVRRQVLKALP